MAKKIYVSPIIMNLDEGESSVVGQGTGQGTYIDGDGGTTPELTLEQWWDEIGWDPANPNPDADYDGNGTVNDDDYYYYIQHPELWNGD